MHGKKQTEQHCSAKHGSEARTRLRPLVELLHTRKELRGVYAPADNLDQAVRWGV